MKSGISIIILYDCWLKDTKTKAIHNWYNVIAGKAIPDNP